MAQYSTDETLSSSQSGMMDYYISNDWDDKEPCNMESGYLSNFVQEIVI